MRDVIMDLLDILLFFALAAVPLLCFSLAATALWLYLKAKETAGTVSSKYEKENDGTNWHLAKNADCDSGDSISFCCRYCFILSFVIFLNGHA